MKKIIIPILTGALMISTAIPFAVQAGRGGGGGGMGGTNLQTQTRNQNQDRLRLRDGSCPNSTASQTGTRLKGGNAYGPGDGTGNAGIGPKDGTGHGAPSQR